MQVVTLEVTVIPQFAYAFTLMISVFVGSFLSTVKMTTYIWSIA